MDTIGCGVALGGLKARWARALQLLQEMRWDATMPDPDLTSWTLVLDAAHQGSWTFPLELLDLAQRQGNAFSELADRFLVPSPTVDGSLLPTSSTDFHRVFQLLATAT